jgi:hypothetical protein
MGIENLKAVSHEDFKRSMLECMRNMATVAGYALAAAYMTKNSHAGTGAYAFAVIVGVFLYFASLLASVFTCDFFIAALARRFPNHLEKNLIFLPTLLLVCSIGFAPAYIYTTH